MSQHTGSHKNSFNLLGGKYLNESHWPMRRIRLLECKSTYPPTNEREREKERKRKMVVLMFVCLSSFVRGQGYK